MKRLTLFILILILSGCAGSRRTGDSDTHNFDNDDNLPTVEEFNEMHEEGKGSDAIYDEEEIKKESSMPPEYDEIVEEIHHMQPPVFEEEVEYMEVVEESSGEYMMDDDADGVPDIMDREPVMATSPEPIVTESESIHVVNSNNMAVESSSNGSGAVALPTPVVDNTPQPAPVVVDGVTPVNPNQLDLNKGSMSYDIPLNMQVGKAHTVRLRISRKKNNNISVGFTHDTTVYEIETSGVMEVKLYDPNPEGVNKQFEIVQMTDGVQALENDERYNEWTWGVTPVRSGEGKLKLIINIKKKTEFGDMNRSITVFEKDIEIKSNHKYFVRKFFYDNWEWFASSIAIPLSIFAWKRREKLIAILRKKDKKEEK